MQHADAVQKRARKRPSGTGKAIAGGQLANGALAGRDASRVGRAPEATEQKLRKRRAETPMAFVRAIVMAYRRYRRDPAAALRQVQITPAQLKRVDARIDAEQLETIAGIAMRELDDEALGWYGRRLPWGTYGMLCRASLTAPSLGVALKLWCKHHRLVTDDVELALKVDGVMAELTLREGRGVAQLRAPMREFCLLSTLRYVHGYVCWLIDSQWPLDAVTWPFAAPTHASVYRLLFPGPSRFGAAQAGLRFDARYLALTPKRDAAALQAMLQRALPLTVRQYRRDRLLAARVRAQLAVPAAPGDSRALGATAVAGEAAMSNAARRALATGAMATAETLAAALHVSVRSLHRQLAQEGTSLQALKDDVHRRRASELLARSDLSVKQLAKAVGFRNQKSFARAFRGWTGESPSEQRRRLRGEER